VLVELVAMALVLVEREIQQQLPVAQLQVQVAHLVAAVVVALVLAALTSQLAAL
jgi:hypothetical protein